MSEENLEIARQAVDAAARRDRDAWLALHHEDFEVVAIDDWPEGDVRGAEAAWNLYFTIYDAIERLGGPRGRSDVERVPVGADKVLLHHRFGLSGRVGGPEVEHDYWDLATIRQGKIIREHWFADRNEALEAAGLSD